MAFDFPKAPVVGDTITASNGIDYTWDGEAWAPAVARTSSASQLWGRHKTFLKPIPP
jgi:hypothetical protein